MADITQQTGVVFSYNTKKLDMGRKVKFHSDIKNVDQFLELLKKETGFTTKVIENYIVITSTKDPVQKNPSFQPVNSPSPAQQKVNVKPPVQTISPPASQDSTHVQSKESPTSPDSIDVQSIVPSAPRDSTHFQSIESRSNETIEPSHLIEPDQKTNSKSMDSLVITPAVVDQSRIDPVSTSFKILPVNDSLTIVHTKPETKKEVVSVVRPSFKNSIKKKLFLKSGITLDESTYMGVIIQSGLPIAYATASVNSNRLATHFRYGIGSSVKLNPSLRLHLTINNGDVSRSGFFTDSLGVRSAIDVKSQLFRVGLGIEFRLKGKLTIQLISNFNKLSTTYFINHTQSDLSRFNSNGDELFYTIAPPYLISNTFSPNSDSNVKSWIGLQLNFLYRINFY